MFSGFNLAITEDFFNNDSMDFEQYIELGKIHLQSEIKTYKKNLERFIKGGTIDGSELQENWFPEIEADIFISHSHDDKDLANAFAGWLNAKFGLKVFIDSNVWGYSGQLLDEINDEYSDKRPNVEYEYIYDYSSCNMASQHVNIMLSAALQKMIDKVECVILLNSNRSVKVFQGNRINTKTYSPWIYSEILCTQIVRKKPLLSYRNYQIPIHESTDVIDDVFYLVVSYNISLDHLIALNEIDLSNWLNIYSSYNRKYSRYPLDALYCSTHPDDLYRTKKLFSNQTLVAGLIKFINGSSRQQYENTKCCNCFEIYLRCSENCEKEFCPLTFHNQRIE